MALKKNLFYNSLLSISQILFPLVSIPYISRILSVDGIGQVNTIDSMTYFLVVIAELGLSTYGVREISKVQSSNEKLKQRTNELISLHIISTLVTCIIYAISIFLYWQKIHSATMVLFSVLFFVSSIFNCEWYYWGTEKFKYIAIRSIATRSFGLTFIFLLIKSSADFEKYYGIMVCTFLVNIIFNASTLLPNFKFTKKNIVVDFKASIAVYFIGLLYSVTNMLDNVILSLTASFVAVANYSNAVKIVRISGALITDSFIVFFSRTNNLIAENKTESVHDLLSKTIELIWLFSIPLSAGLIVFAAPFTYIYFGENLTTVASNLMILSIFPMLKSFNLLLGKQILMSNHLDSIALYGYILSSSIFVVLNILLSSFYADLGCSFAIVISEFIMMVYFIFKSTKYITLKNFELLKNGAIAFFTLLLFYFIKLLIYHFMASTLFSFFVAIFISLFFYIVLVLGFSNYVVTKHLLMIIKRKIKN